MVSPYTSPSRSHTEIYRTGKVVCYDVDGRYTMSTGMAKSRRHTVDTSSDTLDVSVIVMRTVEEGDAIGAVSWTAGIH